MNPDNIPFINDPGLLLETEPDPNVDPGMNMDTERTMDWIVCLNCGSDVAQRRRHILRLSEVVSVIRQWIAPRVIEDDNVICHSCWTLALNETNTQVNAGASTSDGHRRHMCVTCGSSILRTRSHTLHTGTEREAHILNVVAGWIEPRQLRGTDQICHPCWQRADRVTSYPAVTLQNNVQSIYLPNITRAPDTQACCFFPECGSLDRLTVPKWLRVKLFTDEKFYVPKECRICSFHLFNYNWHINAMAMPQAIHSFTSEQIEDFATFVNERMPILDFNNIASMSDDIVRFWIGVSKEQFREILDEVPRLRQIKRSELALAAYLLKLRTGDNDARVSIILNVPRTTLYRLMSKARDILVEDLVPRNLGLNHISRQDIIARNLLIPNGLFGIDSDGVQKPIVIMDGTYLYVQKSSNYMYQKETYSLHKYRNLMKPFVMTCSDGYILDVLGPYPATMSDANIIKNEFSDETKPLRQYFQAGDVFIMDRGFRDCVQLLQECNYSVHVPASREEGEAQLSTLAANQSRTVTICRWVVEAVNGIFKQSYKLLRHEFFNNASKHAMPDFRVAAALINKFHQRISDREDAGEILNIINYNLHRNNDLSHYVTEHNLNRRRAQFRNINVFIENISFPRLEYRELILLACGTYQLKQARSYYGEHIRNDGTYTIEVCREIASNLPRYPCADLQLLRAKIHSRHINKRIYYVYIAYESNNNGREAIKQYLCNCIVGRRTVGCCAHVMTILWFMSWARYEANFNPPAQFLDHVLLTYESD